MNLSGANGGQPGSDMYLVKGTDGNLWSTTQYGGLGYRTIFNTSLSGPLTTMYVAVGPFSPKDNKRVVRGYVHRQLQRYRDFDHRSHRRNPADGPGGLTQRHTLEQRVVPGTIRIRSRN